MLHCCVSAGARIAPEREPLATCLPLPVLRRIDLNSSSDVIDLATSLK